MKHRYNVFLVDGDSKTFSDLASLDWASLDADLTYCTSGMQALKKAMKTAPDLVVSNIRLPDMRFCEYKQELKRFSSCQVIVYTSERSFGYLREAFAMDAYAYIINPLEVSFVLRMAKYALNGVARKDIYYCDEEFKMRIRGLQNMARADDEHGIAKAAYMIIRERYAEKISVGDVANLLYVSESHLMHEMKRVMGVSFHDCLTNCRIEKAKQLFAESNFKIKEVAYAVGISDARYFARVFKKETGMTPTEYINKTQTNRQSL